MLVKAPTRDDLCSRLIGLLAERQIAVLFSSDACYGGIGGWSLEFRIIWRLTRDDLIMCVFPMKALGPPGEPASPNVPRLHMNPLEFVGIIINLWFVCGTFPNQTILFRRGAILLAFFLTIRQPCLGYNMPLVLTVPLFVIWLGLHRLFCSFPSRDAFCKCPVPTSKGSRMEKPMRYRVPWIIRRWNPL